MQCVQEGDMWVPVSGSSIYYSREENEVLQPLNTAVHVFYLNIPSNYKINEQWNSINSSETAAHCD